MEWLLRDGPIYLIVGGMVFFIVFMVIQSRRGDDKNKPKE